MTPIVKTEIPSFCLKPEEPASTANPMIKLRQYGNYVCSKQGPLTCFRGYKWGYLFFLTERDWS